MDKAVLLLQLFAHNQCKNSGARFKNFKFSAKQNAEWLALQK